jgi:hypothetical protein
MKRENRAIEWSNRIEQEIARDRARGESRLEEEERGGREEGEEHTALQGIQNLLL